MGIMIHEGKGGDKLGFSGEVAGSVVFIAVRAL